ncbi:MAG: hypothetical protein CM15mP51_20490 [Porticoccaceae bacterium]|nr:MAG: hypothetical protein CM15mP51_20490 [Porticoccaceae bacterium]
MYQALYSGLIALWSQEISLNPLAPPIEYFYSKHPLKNTGLTFLNNDLLFISFIITAVKPDKDSLFKTLFIICIHNNNLNFKIE